MLAAALLATLAGCGDRPVEEWPAQSVSGVGRLQAPEVAPETFALDGTSRVSVTVPRVYRVRLDGEVSRNGLTTPIAVGGWLLVVTPYAAATQPVPNDENVVDVGLVTDTSPLDGRPGALWFGTHTSVMGDLDLGGVTPNAGPVDVVTQAADGDLLVAQVIPELAGANPLNLFDVDEGGPLGPVREGSLQLRFDADATALTGRIDFADPASGAAYHADLTGSATN